MMLSDTIKNDFSDVYEKTKTNEVKIVFDYKANPATKNPNELIIYYDKNDMNNSIKLYQKEYPNKILDKYYLIEKLKSKDTLKIKLA